jgi:cysteine dioxygenase
MENLIESINEHLKNKDLFSSRKILCNYNKDDWRNYVSFDNIHYKRNLVYKNDIFEIILICWKKNQESPIHDHPENGCIFKVLEGSIIELKKNSIRTLNINDIGYSIGKNVHQIKAIQDTITLHVYSPPNYIPNIIRFFQ